MKRRELTFLIVGMILAAVMGGLVGDVVGSFLPEGTIKTLFQEHIPVGFSPLTIDLYALQFTFGLMVKINFVSILFVMFVFVYFRWWYLA